MKNRLLLAGLFAALSALTLLLAGCSGDSGTPTLPADPQPAAMGRVLVSVKWPTADSRMIPSTLMRIEVSVSGQGIATPITETLTQQTPSRVITVPAGVGRLFEAKGYTSSVGGAPIVAGFAENVSVAAGTEPQRVPIPIVGLNEPANNEAVTASVITMTEPRFIVDILDNTHSVTAQWDTTDWVQFPAVAGRGYSVKLHFIEGEGEASIEAYTKDTGGVFVPYPEVMDNGHRYTVNSVVDQYDPRIAFNAASSTVWVRVSGSGKIFYQLSVLESVPVSVEIE
jgi:hypothetical protein